MPGDGRADLCALARVRARRAQLPRRPPRQPLPRQARQVRVHRQVGVLLITF